MVLYRSKLKKREFGKEAPHNFDLERATIAGRQGASENRNYEAKPTRPKTASSAYFGINFTKAKFLLSALLPNEFPHLKTAGGTVFPEIAFVGRSNAGKSSFINALLQTKTLVKTSATPGKTQRINFFVVDETLLLVDLPGYGYAKAPKDEIRHWSHAIDEYLNDRPSLRMIFLVLDLRRTPSREDLAMAEWAHAKGISLFILFTKRDKLSDAQVEQAVQTNLAKFSNLSIAGFFAVSNLRLHERRHVIQQIKEHL